MIIKTKLIQVENVSTAILGPLRDFSWTETLVLNHYLYKLGSELSSQESNCLMSFLLARLETYQVGNAISQPGMQTVRCL